MLLVAICRTVVRVMEDHSASSLIDAVLEAGSTIATVGTAATAGTAAIVADVATTAMLPPRLRSSLEIQQDHARVATLRDNNQRSRPVCAAFSLQHIKSARIRSPSAK